MKLVHALSLALTIAVVATPSLAAQQDDSHHPAAASAAVANTRVPAPKANSVSAITSSDIARMDMQLKSMREMHDRMMSAKTPSERSALMDGQMKIMQDGMSMMDRMSASGMAGTNRDMKGGMNSDMAAHHQKMEKRMQMMQAMMQMMMDRMPAAPAK